MKRNNLFLYSIIARAMGCVACARQMKPFLMGKSRKMDTKNEAMDTKNGAMDTKNEDFWTKKANSRGFGARLLEEKGVYMWN